MDRKRVRVRVHGRVQGVWYRGSTQEQAVHLGVTGWVRNMVDGTVQLEAEGVSVAVDALVRWCRQGPRGACVAELEIEALPTTGADQGFEIRY